MDVSTLCSLLGMVFYGVLAAPCLYSMVKRPGIRAECIHGAVCMVNVMVCWIRVINYDSAECNGRTIVYIRYAEWLICCPLMVIEIVVASGLSFSRALLSIILCISFCVCGFLAALTDTMWIKCTLGAQGIVMCVLVFVQIYCICMNDGTLHQSKPTIVNAAVTMIVWSLFIVAWGLGPDVLQFIDGPLEIAIEYALSVVLKTTAMLYLFDEDPVFYDVESPQQVKCAESSASPSLSPARPSSWSRVSLWSSQRPCARGNTTPPFVTRSLSCS